MCSVQSPNETGTSRQYTIATGGGNNHHNASKKGHVDTSTCSQASSQRGATALPQHWLVKHQQQQQMIPGRNGGGAINAKPKQLFVKHFNSPVSQNQLQ